MSDYTLNGPVANNNPWAPAGLILAAGSIQSDVVGWRPTGILWVAAAHDANYDATSIVSEITIAQLLTGDNVIAGAVVRTGANAGAIIGVCINVSDGTAFVRTYDSTGTPTSISTGATLPTTLAVGDLFIVTVAISAGTATITATQTPLLGSPTAITFNANTTTTFTGEASLAAGHAFDPQNSNATRLSKFEGTGVASDVLMPQICM